MRHVLVETNWLVECAGPVPFRDPEAVDLLERARQGELRLHLPSICLTEVRHSMARKGNLENEINLIKGFLVWAGKSAVLNADVVKTADASLISFQNQMRAEQDRLSETLDSFQAYPNLDIFAMNEAMFEK